MASVVADIFREAARLNAEDPRRRGNVVCLDSPDHVIVTGDLHGNRAALAKIVPYASLAGNADRRLVLQELVHGPVDPRTGQDRSAEVLLRAARLKVASPEQVFFLIGNHDIAQLTGNEILKDGRSFCRSFDEGVDYCFEGQALEVRDAIREFLESLPLAVRCANKAFLCHSLPAPNREDIAGVEIFDRPYRPEDMRRGGPLYEWTWGRGHTPEQLDALAERLDVELFVLGHQPCETGYRLVGDRCVLLSTDHQHGCILEFAGDVPFAADEAIERIRPVAALGRGRSR